MKRIQINSAKEIKANSNIVKVLKLNFASIKTEIDCIYGYSFKQFREYLIDFDQPDVLISISEQDIEEEKKKHKEICEPEIHVDNELVAVTYDYGFLEPIIALKKISDAVIKFDTLLIHGAVVAKEGYAYAFLAPSGVGKSTRIKIWMDVFPDSTVVNGDKPFIKFTEEGVFACGSPWCGKEGWNSNIMVPLQAIFFVERAEEKINIQEISIGNAFPLLIQQTHQPHSYDLIMQTINLLKRLNRTVRLYKLSSPPTPEAVKLAYETAKPNSFVDTISINSI